MLHSEQIGQIAAALALAQATMKNPERNRSVTVSTKTGGSYEFSYATIDNIIDVARKPLADNGIAYIQELGRNGEGLVMRTRLLHKSGEWIETETPVTRPAGEGAQAMGSLHTYFRRYALQEALGLSAEEDDDGNAAEGNSVKDKGAKKPAVKTAVPMVSEADGWKLRAENLRTSIKAAVDSADLDWIWDNNKQTREEIERASKEAIKILDKVKAEMQEQFKKKAA